MMAAPPSGAARNPRDVITEDALFVDPTLIGLPLARPWRRAVAMAIDGLLITFLTQAPGILFGLASALVLFRVSARRSPICVGSAPRSAAGWTRWRSGWRRAGPSPG